MNWDIELNINTDVQRFENWLEVYRHKTLPFTTAQVEGRWLSVLSSPIIHQDPHQGLIIHEFQACVAHVEYHETIQAKTEIHSDYFPVIRFVIIETTSDRINVKLSCLNPQLVPYFNQLLIEVAKLWPETDRKIQAHINQFTQGEKFDNDEENVPNKERKITLKVTELAEFIKQEKGKQPDLSYMQLAWIAQDKYSYLKDKGVEQVAENLRYAYREVLKPSGWQWERADRIR